jgi:hypothetical protein
MLPLLATTRWERKVLVSRRRLLTAAAAAPATLWLGTGTAQAYAGYDVAVCEQYRNQIQIYSSTTNWTTPEWIWSPGGGGWSNNIQFFDATGTRSFTKGLPYGAEFYKSRLHTVGYH